MKFNFKNKSLAIFSVILISFLFLLIYLSVSKSPITLTLDDYKNVSIDYLNDLEYRIDISDTSLNSNKETLKSNLVMIDSLYTWWQINISEDLFFIPPSECSTDICFSVREMYLFQLNF